jgi:hypothetical protein
MLYIVWTTADTFKHTYPETFKYEGTCDETGLDVFSIITDVDINVLLNTDHTVVKYWVV